MRVFDNLSVQSSWFGTIADYDGVSGTDNTAALQAAIDFFGVARGVVELMAGRMYFAGSVDFKRVALRGVDPNTTFDSGVSSMTFAAPHGIYTSIEDNRCPLHERFQVGSVSERTQNGQTLLNLTGVNYPRLRNILLYGGEVGLKIKNGSVVETHYGDFYSVDCSRCYKGVSIEGGQFAQTHNFFGGRLWDCVEAYVNEDGVSDINFHGTAFESDRDWETPL